jgi:MtN3 and saliva related transmembrane protein
MIESLIPWIGVCAAVLTSLSYIPQVRKAWPRGSTKDLSLHMLLVLTAGLLLWVGYGLLKSDWVIVAANSVGAALSGSVLAFKIRICDRGAEASECRLGHLRISDGTGSLSECLQRNPLEHRRQWTST